MSKITPCLWFNGDAEEATNFYVSLLPDSRIDTVQKNTTDGPGVITDFNNTTQHDHIAVSAAGFGGNLTAGMDVSSTFETSGDNQFSGDGAQFHFDTANQTLYFSADGSQASAHAITSVQAGVTLNAHDILIV